MNESVYPIASTEESTAQDDTTPEFGLVDVVEAFTAMRHEYRGQTKESRQLAESIQTAASNIQELDAKLRAQVAGSSTDETRKFARLIADTDNHLTRAIAAAIQSETSRSEREESDLQETERYFRSMNVLARWLARPLLTFVIEQRQVVAQSKESPAIEGLNLVLARLRRMMKEHQIKRIDTLGQPFDAETMNAIGTVATQDYPAGHVAEQLSPGYRWRADLLQFADVRVAT